MKLRKERKANDRENTVAILLMFISFVVVLIINLSNS